MPLGFLKKIFGTQMHRDVRKFWPVVEEINALAEGYSALPAEQLPAKTEEFRQRLQAGEEVEALLPEAYALVKDACRRLVGQQWDVMGISTRWEMVPFDVQILGGISLHQGSIAEMATGEGKTLVATMPLYLNALTGKGAHLVTVNDYLAERDARWMGPVYESLGLTVGVITAGLDHEQRQAAYGCDITYGTNNEFGFDYLRDNMAPDSEHMVQRGFHFVIVDEVDSILVDEARTPLIISGPVPASTSNERFKEFKPLIERLFRKQQRTIAGLVSEAEKLAARSSDLTDDERWQLGTRLLQIRHGSPKQKRFQKIMLESGMSALLTQVENANLRDKTMPELDSVLFFIIDEKGHSIELTEQGLDSLSEKDRELFVLPDLSEKVGTIDQDAALDATRRAEAREKAHREYAERSDLIHMLQQLLRAYSLYEKDVEYVVQDGKVLIVDEFTGRILQGRRYSEGLHQAIEAKEDVRIEGQTQTYATITYQNFFRMYEKLAGMTGTAITEETEFWEIYKLKVVIIPTNRPCVRSDEEDRIYRTRKEKVDAILEEIARLHAMKLPVLVGTVSVEFSETLSRLLKRRNIQHNVLNAKQHQREAEIIISAGQPGAVTIATNMAGRGTDIKLHPGVLDGSALMQSEGEVENPRGLQIIGTERHESRRIDRQLRGRAGRQGDAGRSLFFISLEDSLMRLFAGDRIGSIMDRIGIQEGEVITHAMVTRAIEKAQMRVEAHHFDIRKHVLKYDDVMNTQREVIYDRRGYYLESDDLAPEMEDKVDSVVEDMIAELVAADEIPENWDTQTLFGEFESLFLGEFRLPDEEVDALDVAQLTNIYKERAAERLALRRATLPPELYQQVCRFALLRSLDEGWREHLLELDSLKSGIGLRAYGQKDPLVEFKVEAFGLFEELISRAEREALRTLFHVEIGVAPERYEGQDLSRASARHDAVKSIAETAAQAGAPEGPADPASAIAASGASQPQAKPQPAVAEEKVGRNDPCPCGSGKKYKKCCGSQG